MENRWGRLAANLVAFVLIQAALIALLYFIYLQIDVPFLIEIHLIDYFAQGMADPEVRGEQVMELQVKSLTAALIAIGAGAGLTLLWLVLGTFWPVAKPQAIAGWKIIWALFLLIGLIVSLWFCYELVLNFQFFNPERMLEPLIIAGILYLLFYYVFGTLWFSTRSFRPAPPLAGFAAARRPESIA